MTNIKCGGTITLEEVQDGNWANQSGVGQRLIWIGRCDKCGLAGIVCVPPK